MRSDRRARGAARILPFQFMISVIIRPFAVPSGRKNARLAAIRRAPLTADELKRRAAAQIDAMAQACRPTFDKRSGEISFGPRTDVFAPGRSVSDVVGLDRGLIDQQIDAADLQGLSDEERADQGAKARVELFELELLEQAIMEDGAAIGVDIARSSDADPQAIFGVTFTNGAAPAA
jgi:hypothetical protein